MLKYKLKKFMPSVDALKEYKILRIFGKAIFNHNLWHLNRHSVSRAFAVGLFCAWNPVPFQMALAAGFSLLFHSNLPLSVALVWLTNPITMPPLFYLAYKIGTVIMSIPAQETFNINLAFQAIMHIFTGNSLEGGWNTFTVMLKGTWKPFLLGCAVCGVVSSVVGYFAIKLIWRHFTVKHWKERQQMKLQKKISA